MFTLGRRLGIRVARFFTFLEWLDLFSGAVGWFHLQPLAVEQPVGSTGARICLHSAFECEYLLRLSVSLGGSLFSVVLKACPTGNPRQWGKLLALRERGFVYFRPSVVNPTRPVFPFHGVARSFSGAEGLLHWEPLAVEQAVGSWRLVQPATPGGKRLAPLGRGLVYFWHRLRARLAPFCHFIERLDLFSGAEGCLHW